MSRQSDEFEQLVTRIQSVLEDSEAEIEWDDHISDASDPEVSRQIDFTIRRDGRITIGECRLRQGRQDVTWIEQLYGKQRSVDADEVIAVSDAGFSKLAITKAKEWGIELRDFEELNDEDIAQWGMRTRISMRFIVYDTLHIGIGVSRENWTNISPDISKPTQSDKNILKIVLNKLVNSLNEQPKEMLGRWLSADYAFNISSERLFKLKPSKITCSGRIMITEEDRSLSLVAAYDRPGVDTIDRDVFVERDTESDTEIIKSENRAMLTMDLSAVSLPPGYLYARPSFDFRKQITATIVPVGKPSIALDMSRLTFGVFLSGT